MKNGTRIHHSGAALIVTLILVTAIVLVTISYFSICRQEMEVSQSTVAITRADLGLEAAFAEAGGLLQNATANDRYLVTAAFDESETGQRVRYTFLTLPGSTEVSHRALFSGGGTQTQALPNLDTMDTTTLLDKSVAVPEVKFDLGMESREIRIASLTHLTTTGKPELEEARPKTIYQEIEAVEGTPYQTRYCYWIEDLEGYPNLDVVGTWSDRFGDSVNGVTRDFQRYGYSEHDSRVSGALDPMRFQLEGSPVVFFQFPSAFRGQTLVNQVATGLSPREICLFPWSISGLPSNRHPYFRAPELASLRNFLSAPKSLSEPPEQRFSSGLSPYLRRPLIPYGHGYPDQGKPRFNLNTLVANRDLQIADIVSRNLPFFRNRAGGFPDDEDYLATLAANAIDYADVDSLPSLPSNTLNAKDRRFRGVDSYCPINEFFLKFEYVGFEAKKSGWNVLFEATPYVEFWNTSNRPAKMSDLRLRFQFLETIRFKANGTWQKIEETQRTLDGAFPLSGGFSATVAPNEYQVLTFRKIRWTVPVSGSNESPIAFPVVQDIRGVANVSVRAQYELYLGKDRVDQCGRPDPTDDPKKPAYGFFFSRYLTVISPGEFYMQLATPGMASQVFGFNAPRGSSLGDPWMHHYSRSTAAAAEYQTQATPASRNYDHGHVDDSHPDWIGDQTRVRDWPDRGYESAVGVAVPSSDQELPDAFNHPANEEEEAFAPWRISNLARYFSVTELGNLHDPAMWIPGPVETPDFSLTKPSTHRFDLLRNTWLASLPLHATPGKMWGGGNTLRIGRPEHELFDRPGMRASQWLDLFHVGINGSNLGPEEKDTELLYRHYDPRDHQPPATALDPVQSLTQPYSLVYENDLHAQGKFELLYGKLNLNSAPTLFEIEALLRGPSVLSDIRLTKDSFETPEYEREGKTGILRGALKEEAIPLIAAGLSSARPFYSPSHLARVFSGLLKRHDALPDHFNDAEAEEPFARLFNTTSLTSRHFRIYTYAEVFHRETGFVAARGRRVYEVFLRPIRNEQGEVTESRLEVITSRDL